MSFFTDALGDGLIGAGTVKLEMRETMYVDGFGTQNIRTVPFKASKSIQPLSPEEAQAMGFADYSTNEFVTVFTLKKLPLPSKQGTMFIVKINKKDWVVRKILPWVWDEGTPFEQGYWEVVLSKFDETNINPN